jgi:hypothetical protein
MHDMLPEPEGAISDESMARLEPDAAADVHLNDASGSYRSDRDDGCRPQRHEELRIDVDGRFPQMMASGTIRNGIEGQLHWLAPLTTIDGNRWTGGIIGKDGSADLLPHTVVDIAVRRTPFGIGQTATATFSGGGIADRTRVYRYVSRYFRSVEFEVDTVQVAHAAAPAAAFDTLSIEKAFRRAGFNVSQSGGDGALPIAADAPWSDMELHDAMQTYWSRFAGRSPRAMWVLFAPRHESGCRLDGIAFEDVGPDRRPGAALFDDSSADASIGEAGGPVRRDRASLLRTACRAMGRALAPRLTPWSDARPIPSPSGVGAGGLDFRFSDHELQVLRHAPERQGRVGDAGWFDHHGFEPMARATDAALRLEVRVDRAKPVFEFLEPVMLELRLTNVSDQPVTVDEDCLAGGDDVTVIIKKSGQPARRWVSYARVCRWPSPRVLAPGHWLGQSLFAGAGRNGWDLAEPGVYEVQAALHRDDGDVVSDRLRLRIAAPRDFEEETLAQDFFSDDVGRILAFDGSRVLEAGNGALDEIVQRLPGRRVAVHARLALAVPMSRSCKQLVLGGRGHHMASAADVGGRIEVRAGCPDAARKGLALALLRDPPLAAETLGHVDYRDYVDRFSRWLSEQNDPRAAAACRAALRATLPAIPAQM